MRTHLGAVATATLLVFAAQGARGQCCGDCDGNGTVAINELITAVNNALGECQTGGCGLLATGQRTSYGPGSDGDVQAGAARSATDKGDGTITDNTTGLMWEKKSDDGSIHDLDNAYTWGREDPPYTMNGTMVTAFLSALNTSPCFAGHCDWRIPNVRELQSLVDYEVSGANPTTFTAFNRNCALGCTVDGVGGPRCSCTRQDSYWSSTTFTSFPKIAFEVSFDDGYVLAKVKSDGGYVRAVRGGL